MKDRKDFWAPWFVCWAIGLAFFFGVGAILYFYCECENTHEFLAGKVVSQLCIVATIIVAIIFNFIDYRSFNKFDNKSVKMKFNHFKDAYYVNPDRWEMIKGRLTYEYEERYYKNLYYVVFSYFDWLRFLLWCMVDEYYERRKIKRKKEEDHNARMANMLKHIQMDINKAYEKIKDTAAEGDVKINYGYFDIK